MEIEGINLDVKFLKKLSERTTIELEDITKEIYELAGEEFNISSPKQLGEVLYNDLKISDLKKTKKGSFATSASVLELSLIHI